MLRGLRLQLLVPTVLSHLTQIFSLFIAAINTDSLTLHESIWYLTIIFILVLEPVS